MASSTEGLYLLPEVLDMVLSFLKSEFQSDLRQHRLPLSREKFSKYLLVSKDWLHLGRKHLFKTIAFYISPDSKIIDQFTLFLTESPHLKPYIRSLRLDAKPDTPLSINTLATLVHHVPLLDDLTLTSFRILSDGSTQTRQALPSHHLEELQLFSVHPHEDLSTLSPFHHFFSLFASIKTVTSQYCTFGPLNHHNSGNKLPITRLNYCCNPGTVDPYQPLSTLFEDIIDIGSFAVLGVYLFSPSDFRSLSSFIESTFQSPSQELSVEFSFDNSYYECEHDSDNLSMCSF